MFRVHIFRRRDAFLLRLVDKRCTENDIVNAFDVQDSSNKLVVDHDAPAQIDFNTDVFKVEAFELSPTADGDEHNTRIKLMNFWLRYHWQSRDLRITHTHTDSCSPSFTDSVTTTTFPSFFSEERSFVLSLNLRPCLVEDFRNCLLSTQYMLVGLGNCVTSDLVAVMTLLAFAVNLPPSLSFTGIVF